MFGQHDDAIQIKKIIGLHLLDWVFLRLLIAVMSMKAATWFLCRVAAFVVPDGSCIVFSPYFGENGMGVSDLDGSA